MDQHFKRLAEAGLALEEAERALADGEFQSAQDGLDRVDLLLAELRAAWADLSAPERRVIGPAARDIRVRRDAAAARVPRRRALVAGAPEADPEQEVDPEEVARAAA